MRQPTRSSLRRALDIAIPVLVARKPADRRAYEPIGAALIGQLAGAILFLVIGVKAATASTARG